ncbi:MAG: ATP-binding protein [Prolixibacteraceae bacterium]
MVILALPKNEIIAKTVIAFSNTSGGKLIIGVNDNRKITGINDNELFDIQDNIASVIADNCSRSYHERRKFNAGRNKLTGTAK